MFARFGRSVDLAKASFGVLRSDKELLIFPLVSFIVLVLVSISFFVPFCALGGVSIPNDGGSLPIVAYVVLFLFYLVSYTVTFFFNTALVGAALIRLDGGDPTLGDGFRIALSRLPQIVGYALIAATVGMVLRAISERAGIIGTIIAGLIGFAWNVATFLVVPVLAVEGIGPIAAIKRSGGLLRQTWGEQIIGNVGIGLLFGLLSFVVIVVGVLAMVLLFQTSVGLGFVALVVMLLALGIIGLIGSAVSGIYVASLYRYATKGNGGTMFSPADLSGAFRQRG